METVEIAGGILWYTARKHLTRRGNASGRTSEEVAQQDVAEGFGSIPCSGREEVRLYTIGGVPREVEKLLPGVRGCASVHISDPPKIGGIKGVDEIQVGEPVAGTWRGVAVNALS
jgi:hypothetical protein